MTPRKTFSQLSAEISEKVKIDEKPYLRTHHKLKNLKVPIVRRSGKIIDKDKKVTKETVQSADRKPEKYMKPDGKMGVRMVRTDKEVIKKESIDNHPKVKAARKAHAAGTWDGNVDKEGEAVVHINGKPHTVTNRYGKKKTNEIAPAVGALARTAVATAVTNKLTSKKKTNEAVEYPHMMYDPKTGKEVTAKTPADHNKFSKMGYTHEKPKNENLWDNIRKRRASGKPMRKPGDKGAPTAADLKQAQGESTEVDEALTLQQRMAKKRLMKRYKGRIAIGRKRAARKMANKKTLEKRAQRQARNELAKKLTRGIPKKELSFARKQEIEKRLDKPQMKTRIKRMARRMFKDIRKKEVQRKKG